MLLLTSWRFKHAVVWFLKFITKELCLLMCMSFSSCASATNEEFPEGAPQAVQSFLWDVAVH
eukprot:2384805-Amphidinium_carterae.1